MSIKERLLNSEEYAGDDAVPAVAHDAVAEIMGLERQIADLRRGEFICKQCGLRKNSEPRIGFDF